jgi:hypothetical protein
MNERIQSQSRTQFEGGGVMQQRIDDRANGADDDRKRQAELQAKPTMTEGERMELHILLTRRYPARPPFATY